MMIKLLTLLGMLYLHIVDDYYLQGFLASAKQKEWWTKNYPDDLYKHDYIIALIEHGFSWTIAVMTIPAISLLYRNITDWNHTLLFAVVFLVNWFMHCCIDDLKANKKCVSLVTDQILHFDQVYITWFIFMV